MDNQIDLSIIIPVYNIEKYIEECVESIIEQNPQKCEIILVNDGSTDGSKTICEEYDKKYSFIRLINKENGGLSSARNAGLDVAKGKYITFIDGDDKIKKGSLEQILRWINKDEFNDVDICFLKIIKVYNDKVFVDMGDGIKQSEIQGKSKNDILNYLSDRPKFAGSACGKLYKNIFLKTNNLRFPNDRRYSEDLGFTRDCILKAQLYSALDIGFYLYRQDREHSITFSMDKTKHFFDLSLFVAETVGKVNAQYADCPCEKRCLLSFAAYEYMILLLLLNNVNKTKKTEAEKILRKYRWVLSHGQAYKIKMINVATKFAGIKVTSNVLGMIKK